MITAFLLNLFSSFVSLLVGFLPTGALPSGIGDAFNYFVGLVNTFSYIMPVDTLLQAMVVVLGFDSAILVWHLLNWVIRKIPGMQ